MLTFQTRHDLKNKIDETDFCLTFKPTYINVFHQKHNTTQFKTCQYVVYPPFLWLAAWMRRGMLWRAEIRSIPGWFQWPTFLWLLASDSYRVYATLSFVIVYRFSIGLWPVLVVGHSSRKILFFFRDSVATFDRWNGAPSCMNIVQPWTFNFSLSNSTYLDPFILVLGGMKYRPAAPRHDMAPQIIWLVECFIATQHISCLNAYPMAS